MQDRRIADRRHPSLDLPMPKRLAPVATEDALLALLGQAERLAFKLQTERAIDGVGMVHDALCDAIVTLEDCIDRTDAAEADAGKDEQDDMWIDARKELA